MSPIAESQQLPTADEIAAKAVSAADGCQTQRVRQLREWHWAMLGLSTAIVAASLVLWVDGDGRVAPLGLPGLSLPQTCASRSILGVDCPGCGLTRSFVALAHGDIAASFHFHQVGWVIALFVIAQIPYRIYRLRELRTKIVDRSWPTKLGLLLVGNYIGKRLAKLAGVW
jgi:hypothetical protein